MCIKHGIREPEKTIVCGHYSSFVGHALYEGKDLPKCKDDLDFSPFYSDGIIAIDG